MKTHTLLQTALITSLLFLTACNGAEKPKEKTAETINSQVNSPEFDTVDARLDQWFEEKYMENVRQYPQRLAQLGIKERMDEWNDPSRAFALEQLDRTIRQVEELKSNFDVTTLNENSKLSYRLFVDNAERSVLNDKWWHHNYPFNQMFGTHSSIPTFLLNQHPISSVIDAENYIKRLEGVDEYLGEVVKNSKTSADKGIMPPKFVYDHVIRDANNILSGMPFDNEGDLNLLLADFQKKVKKLELSESENEKLFTAAILALQESVKPAYENLITEMRRQQTITSTDDGAWKLPDGDDYYANRLLNRTTTDMTATEIHDLGLTEVDRIHAEMRAIMKSVGFEGDLQSFFTYLQEDDRFTYEDSDAGRQAYLDEATAMIDRMAKELDSVFIKKPEAKLEVRKVEAFREKSAGKAFYQRPAADGTRPGYYYANLYRIGDMPKYQMEALAYHEGIPGHHMQIAIAQELKGIPKFRKYGGYTAYSEGWGLYSEYLPKEMGFYQDPYSDFGRLAMELWRAARLVVDTGLHDKKWTREEAINYLTTNTPNPEGDCIKAIERYIVMPGQATAYKIGMLKIQELRENAKDSLGDKFDIREFHDVVLAAGPVPLNIMQERVEEWVASQ